MIKLLSIQDRVSGWGQSFVWSPFPYNALLIAWVHEVMCHSALQLQCERTSKPFSNLERGLKFERETQRLCDRRSSREEILDFMLRDFDCYAWSIRTLDRRLRYYDIIYTNTDVAVTAWLQSNAEKAKPSS